jgi:hypothetical protein
VIGVPTAVRRPAAGRVGHLPNRERRILAVYARRRRFHVEKEITVRGTPIHFDPYLEVVK